MKLRALVFATCSALPFSAPAATPSFSATLAPFGQDSANITPLTADTWRIQTTSTFSGDSAGGLRLLLDSAPAPGRYALRVSLRSETTPFATGLAYARLVAAPLDRTAGVLFETSLQADGTWRDFFIPFRIREPVPGGALLIQLGASLPGQIADVRGLSVEALTSDANTPLPPATGWTYPGREPDAPWRVAARERIDRLRRADFSIMLTDAARHPRAGEPIEVELFRHAFPFGTAVQAHRLLGASADDLRYRRELEADFNAAVFENDLKWPALAGDWKDMPPAQTLAALAWLRDRDFRVRGHCLLWGSPQHAPRAVRPLYADPATLHERVLAHAREAVAATRGKIADWDVVNEVRDHGRAYELLGPARAAEWFHAARDADPQARLFVNEFDNLNGRQLPSGNQRRLLDWVDALRAAGAPLDAIGEQAHFWNSAVPPPDYILRSLDQLATSGLPIVITEFDFNTSDEALQADFTRDFLTLAFSHPAVDGFYFWGFWAGAHWSPGAALFRSDWSEKPSLRAYRDLVHGEWKTRATIVTNAAGVARFRGFPGNYIIRLPTQTHRIRLTPDAPNATLVRE